MDDEDENITSELTSSVTILSKKCKPFNICLDRLDIPKNGVILIDNEPTDSKNAMADSVTTESNAPSTSTVAKGEIEGDDSSNDAAETIKKIKEFIAKCEEPKKVLDVLEKEVNYKPRPLSKKRLIDSKEKQKTKDAITELAKLHTNLELERTLKGLTNEQDSEENIDIDKSVLASCEDSNMEKDLHINNISLISSKQHDSVTPSRVSKRIQSKSVKFSVKKMLRGDDVNVLKRMIPGYEDEVPKKKERSTPKVFKNETKIILSPKSPSPSNDSTDGMDISKEVNHTNSVDEEEPSEDPTVDPISSPVSPSPAAIPPASNSKIDENKDKMSLLAEKLERFAVTNGKITVELKGNQQKKVVRIAVPPQKSPLPRNALGPDIIVKRVKPVKKTIILPTNVKPTPKTVIEKEILDYRPSNNTSNSPHVKIERIPIPKLKENLNQIKKHLLKRGRPEKKWDHKETGSVASTQEQSLSTETSDQILDSSSSSSIQPEIVNKSTTQNSEEPSLTQQISEALENTVAQFIDSSSFSTDDKKKKKVTDKGNNKKKPKVEIPIKRSTRLRRLDESHEKSQSESEEEEDEEEENEPACLFDKYFITEDRFVEHHDSLDSDSSDDYNCELYSHFFDLRNSKAVKHKGGNKGNDILVTDLMHDITIDLPTWNLHVSSNGEIFNIVQVDIVDGKPTLKKSIEMDLEFNVKVYVDGKLLPEYEGNYNSYESIKELVYFVDQL